MQDAIRLDVFYPHPRERVWRALTDPEALSEWLMPTDFAPRVGHRFTFRTEPERGWSGLVRCEVLELEEPWKLSYSWWGHPRVPTTLVSYRLAEEGDGTRLHFEHSGFSGGRAMSVVARQILARGWGRHLLRKTLPRTLARLAAAPASTRATSPTS